MRYPEKLQPQQVQAYLARLEITDPIQNDLDSLNRLLFAQLTHIPFDSLDVWGAGACPSLQLEDIYRKIIEKGRGGYCFELNTLFRALLNALGFDAYQAVAFILNPDSTPQPPAHNVILCDLNGKRYFMDVGYGGPVPYRALELKEGPQDGFLLKKEDIWYVSRITEGNTRPLTAFRDVPVTINELIPLNFYISQRPDSHFRHLIHLSKRNTDGSIFALDGKEFKIHTSDGITVKEIATIEEVEEIMRVYFSMDPNTAPLRDTL